MELFATKIPPSSNRAASRKVSRCRAPGDRTKLEHSGEACYMWITEGSSGLRERGAYRVGSRVVPRQTMPELERIAERLANPVFSRVESGDGRKREQGDSGRKSRQGSSKPA